MINSKDAPCGTVVFYRGEAYVSRGSAQPGSVTIERPSNPRDWRVVSQFDLTLAD